jgi:hypothetical protein
MKKKNITIDDLAIIVKKGFDKAEKDTDKKIDDLAIMVQKGFTEVKVDMNKRFEQVDNRLNSMVTKAEMNRRFDGLEDRVLASHQKRIEKLEAEVKELREMFAV